MDSLIIIIIPPHTPFSFFIKTIIRLTINIIFTINQFLSFLLLLIHLYLNITIARTVSPIFFLYFKIFKTTNNYNKYVLSLFIKKLYLKTTVNLFYHFIYIISPTTTTLISLSLLYRQNLLTILFILIYILINEFVNLYHNFSYTKKSNLSVFRNFTPFNTKKLHSVLYEYYLKQFIFKLKFIIRILLKFKHFINVL